MYITKQNLKNVSSTLEKNKVYMLRCENYVTSEKYYLENGKVYSAEVFNFQWAKDNAKRTLPNEALFSFRMIDSSKNKLYNINN